ncbi:MAG: hypothetical protein IJD17_01560 [Clostridia bacterium]|nr:hypothetical protein [Clostridia bacterium]
MDENTESNYDPRYYIKGYLFDKNTISALHKLKDNDSGSFTTLLSDKYNYYYCHPEYDLVLNVRKDDKSGIWEQSGGSGELKILRNRFPGIEFDMAGMIEQIAAVHPDIDFSSVMCVYADSYVASKFVRFIENEQEYVAVYYETENRFDFKNGSIFKTEELVDILYEDEYFQPVDPNEEQGIGAAGLGAITPPLEDDPLVQDEGNAGLNATLQNTNDGDKNAVSVPIIIICSIVAVTLIIVAILTIKKKKQVE